MKNKICSSCGSTKYYARGFCKSCYRKQLAPSRWSKKYDFCVKCGKNSCEHVAHGLCRICYSSQETSVPCACGCGLTVPKVGNKIRKFRKGHWLKSQGAGSNIWIKHIERFSGKNNPWYGKFGKHHPAYQHKTKQSVRDQRRATRIKYMSENRGTPTSIEVFLSEMIEFIGVKHVSQREMYGKFVVDEFLPDSNLIIEAYGGYWHGDKRRFAHLSKLQERNAKRDFSRNKYLNRCGHRVLVLWENEIVNNRDWCIKEIRLAIKNSGIPLVQDSV